MPRPGAPYELTTDVAGGPELSVDLAPAAVDLEDAPAVPGTSGSVLKGSGLEPTRESVQDLAGQLAALSRRIVAAHEAALAEPLGLSRLAVEGKGAPRRTALIKGQIPRVSAPAVEEALPQEARPITFEDEAAEPADRGVSTVMALPSGSTALYAADAEGQQDIHHHVMPSQTIGVVGKRMRIEVVSANGLRDADWMLFSGTSDPYCRVELKNRPEHHTFQTPVVWNNLSPVWNFVGFMPDVREDDILVFTVWDKDYCKKDDFLGTAQLKAKDVFDDNGFDGWLSLNEVQSRAAVTKAKRTVSSGNLADEGSRLPTRYAKSNSSFGCGSEIRIRVSFESDYMDRFQAMRQESYSEWCRYKAKISARPPAMNCVTTADNVSLAEANTDPWFYRKLQGMVLLPSSRRRMVWSFLSFLLVLYDTFTIPLIFAFEIEMSSAFIAMSLFVTIFWSADFFANFFVGYYLDGSIEMRLQNLVARYLKGWAVLDLCLVIIDWVYIAIWLMEHRLSRGGVLSVAKSFRAARVIRLVALARLNRVAGLFEEIGQMTQSEVAVVFCGLVETTGMLVSATHFVACAWYFVGSSHDGLDSWVHRRDLGEEGFALQYFVSYHWAFTQFMPASMEVMPENLKERIFAVIVDVFGLIAFSTFVSAITTSMTQLRRLNKTRSSSVRNLRTFLNSNSISTELSYRIMTWINSNKFFVRPRTSIEHIELLKDLPQQLRSSLLCEVFTQVLDTHPLFRFVSSVDLAFLTELCCTIREFAFVRSGHVFSRDDAGTCMYLLHAGVLDYTVGVQSERVSEKGACLAEASLWLRGWRHQGDCIAVSRSDLIGIESKAFHALVDRSWAVVPAGKGVVAVTRYAQEFVRDSGETIADPIHLYTDLWGDRQFLRRLLWKAVERDEIRMDGNGSQRGKLSSILKTVRSSM